MKAKEAEEHKYGKQGKPLCSTKSGWIPSLGQPPPRYSLKMPK